MLLENLQKQKWGIFSIYFFIILSITTKIIKLHIIIRYIYNILWYCRMCVLCCGFGVRPADYIRSGSLKSFIYRTIFCSQNALLCGKSFYFALRY